MGMRGIAIACAKKRCGRAVYPRYTRGSMVLRLKPRRIRRKWRELFFRELRSKPLQKRILEPCRDAEGGDGWREFALREEECFTRLIQFPPGDLRPGQKAEIELEPLFAGLIKSPLSVADNRSCTFSGRSLFGRAQKDGLLYRYGSSVLCPPG